MNKKVTKAGIAVGIFLGVAIVMWIVVGLKLNMVCTRMEVKL